MHRVAKKEHHVITNEEIPNHFKRSSIQTALYSMPAEATMMSYLWSPWQLWSVAAGHLI